MDLVSFFERRALHQATHLQAFVVRPSNPVTGAQIPQHPEQPTAPPPPPVVL